MAKKIHFILQGKGGVGKSMIASLFFQILQSKGKDVVAFDTDPVNATLAGYKEFGIKTVDIIEQNDIDPLKFNKLMEDIIENVPDETHVIVDNGASSFVALGSYLKAGNILKMFEDEGYDVFLHTIIVGGQAQSDTISGFKTLVNSFGESAKILVWLNPFFGAIQHDGKTFEQFKIYEELGDRISSLIYLPDPEKSQVKRDLEHLFSKRISFDTAFKTFQLMSRRRLKLYFDAVSNALGNVEGL